MGRNELSKFMNCEEMLAQVEPGQHVLRRLCSAPGPANEPKPEQQIHQNKQQR